LYFLSPEECITENEACGSVHVDATFMYDVNVTEIYVKLFSYSKLSNY